jgi:hypothetical protein
VIVKRAREGTDDEVDYLVLWVADGSYVVFLQEDGTGSRRPLVQDVQEPFRCLRWMRSVGEVVHDDLTEVDRPVANHIKWMLDDYSGGRPIVVGVGAIVKEVAGS